MKVTITIIAVLVIAALAWRLYEDNRRIERLERALAHLHGG